MRGLDGLEGDIADASHSVNHFERLEDGLLADCRKLDLIMICLLEHTLHQKDVQVHLLAPNSDKVRVVLVELRAAPGLSSCVLRFSASLVTRLLLRPCTTVRFLVLLYRASS